MSKENDLPLSSKLDSPGRLVSLEGFPFTFRAKNEEWRDLQLVSQTLS